MTKKQKKVLRRIIISAVLLVAMAVTFTVLDKTGMVDLENPSVMWRCIEIVAYLIPYLVIGYDILKKAFLGIIHGEVFDENFLMAIATVGAMVLGEYKEASAVMLFYQIGELFQSYAVGKSRKNITALMDIRPDYANIEKDGKLEQVDPDDVQIGTVIVVQPGEKVPIDGKVVEGSSSLNTSALTGESVPREVHVGDEIISGCVNLTGLIKIETSKEFGESTVSKILDLVENSSMKKSRSENFITRFAKYYTPAVCIAALALAVLPPLVNIIMGNPAAWSKWIIRALTTLVISCPCALVISIPLSFFGGIGGASAKGILVKGSNYLEALSYTKYVVCDKTGTLTKGVFQVTEIHPEGGMSEADLLEKAALVESYSNHPISKSLKEAYGKEIDNNRVTDAKELSGHGVSAVVDGHEVAAGNVKLMKQMNIQAAVPTSVGTEIHVVVDGKYAGYILISDVVKPNAKEAISGLKAAGVEKVVMLTGDAKKVADAVGSELGVDEVRSELLPGDKVDEVEKLIADGKLNDKLAKQTVAGVLAGEGTPDEVVKKLGFQDVSDDGALEKAVDEALAANPDIVEKLKSGNMKPMGVIIGAVMKATRGQADAKAGTKIVMGKIK